MFDLYLITPELDAAELLERCRAALRVAPAARVALQLRAKHLPAFELQPLAEALRALTREAGSALLVNGELALARAVAADGVQLPERGPSVGTARAQLPAGMLVGASRHDAAGIADACRAGADFVTLSPVFASPGKGEPLGLSRFSAIARSSTVPVIALGGITAESAAAVVQAGAHGVAVIREVFEARDPAAAAGQLLAAIDAGRRAGAAPQPG